MQHRYSITVVWSGNPSKKPAPSHNHRWCQCMAVVVVNLLNGHPMKDVVL